MVDGHLYFGAPTSATRFAIYVGVAVARWLPHSNMAWVNRKYGLAGSIACHVLHNVAAIGGFTRLRHGHVMRLPITAAIHTCILAMRLQEAVWAAGFP
jgi:hypothetical protein